MKNKPNIYDFILKYFTSKDDLRINLTKPNPQGNYIYATDAHAIVRIPKELSGIEYKNNPKYPNKVNDVFRIEIEKPSTQTFEIESLLVSIFDCQLTTEKDFETCKKCKGEGSKYCKCCGFNNDCKTCNGEGHKEVTKPYAMPYLNGTAVRFMDKIVKPSFLYKVIHTALLLGCNEIKVTESAPTKLLFKVGKLEIIIMTLLESQS